MRAVRQARVVAAAAVGAQPAALEQRADDVAPVAEHVHGRRLRIGEERGLERERRLGRLLDGAEPAREPEQADALDDRPELPRGRRRRLAREPRQRRLERRHLVEVDEARLRAERLPGEARPGARGADDEDEPLLPAERPEAAPAGDAGRARRVGARRSERRGHARNRNGGKPGPAPRRISGGGLTPDARRRLNTRGYTHPLMANETINDPRLDAPALDDSGLEEGVWTRDPETGELIPDYESTFPTINEGEVVHGTVVRVDKDEVLVDIGYKSEGVIPVSELSIRRSVNPADEVSVGDEIAALVMTKEDAEGRLILSKKRARFEIAWKAIEQAHEQGEPVTGRVIEVVKGGLILDLGVRGFLPASLVDIRRVQDLDEFLGQELRCKVIELNRSRNNVVLSRRAVLEEERKADRQRILDALNPGDVVEGVISNIVDFGAFVDLDGMDGLIHISELSWSHVNHPSEVLEIGQKVQVKVLDIDRDRQRISLGLKQTQADPWQQVLESYNEGDIVSGKVTKVVTFGAFVEILPGVEGLVHISELAQHHVENPREVVSQGDTVNVRILEVDAERRRLSLSLKRVDEGMPPQPGVGDEAAPPTIDLSEDVFSDTRAPPHRRPR